MLARVDCLDREDDAGNDAAMAESWDRISTSGLSHAPAPETSDLVRDNMELIRKNLTSALHKKPSPVLSKKKPITRAFRHWSTLRFLIFPSPERPRLGPVAVAVAVAVAVN